MGDLHAPGVPDGAEDRLLVVPPHPAHFEVESWPAFFAVFGFLACVAMVLGSKLLGMLLKREDTYYDR